MVESKTTVIGIDVIFGNTAIGKEKMKTKKKAAAKKTTKKGGKGSKKGC